MKQYNQNIELNLSDLIADSCSPEEYFFWKGIKDRKVYITEEITDNLLYKVILPLEQMMEESNEPITIYINTQGGSVYNGMALVDLLEKSTCPINVKVVGYALSMGALFLTAGAKKDNIKRTCSKYAIGLIHSGSEYIEGTSTQVKDKARFNERYEEILNNFMVDNLNITKEEYENMIRYEWWLTAEDMLRLGLVDELV